MIISNTAELPGRRVVEYKGLVQGNTVRAKHIGRDLMASLKNIVGGEIRGYTELLSEARDEAVNRMSERAELLGANAVINVRFGSGNIAGEAAEIYCYGTAVVVEPV